MERISQKNLEYLVDRINSLTNSPKEAYVKNGNGKYHAQIGNYHIDYAYGGVTLDRMTNERGGVNQIFPGHMPKRELYVLLQSFIKGIDSKE